MYANGPPRDIEGCLHQLSIGLNVLLLVLDLKIPWLAVKAALAKSWRAHFSCTRHTRPHCMFDSFEELSFMYMWTSHSTEPQSQVWREARGDRITWPLEKFVVSDSFHAWGVWTAPLGDQFVAAEGGKLSITWAGLISVLDAQTSSPSRRGYIVDVRSKCTVLVHVCISMVASRHK